MPSRIDAITIQSLQTICARRRFAPNVADVADEFTQLARSFDDGFLPEYAALAWLGAAQCHKALGNVSAEVDLLLHSADASIAADRRAEQLHSLSNDRSHLENALRCYNQALEAYTEESVFRAAIILQIRRIQPHNTQVTSRFASPSHRMHDLDRAADECVRRGDYVAALEKRTEIFDDIVVERRVAAMYTDLLRRNEIARLLLLLWLDLPPSRQSPSHVKLLSEWMALEADDPDDDVVRLDEQQQQQQRRHSLMPAEIRSALARLAVSTLGGESATAMCRAVDRMLQFHSLTPEHRQILWRLREKAAKSL